MGIKDAAERFVLKIALKKGVKAAAAFVISFAASAKIATIMGQLGVTVDPTQLEVGLTAIGTGLVAMGFNWLKQKTSIGAKLL